MQRVNVVGFETSAFFSSVSGAMILYLDNADDFVDSIKQANTSPIGVLWSAGIFLRVVFARLMQVSPMSI